MTVALNSLILYTTQRNYDLLFQIKFVCTTTNLWLEMCWNVFILLASVAAVMCVAALLIGIFFPTLKKRHI